MKVRYERVGDAEVVGREDELVGPHICRPYLAGGGDVRLQGPEHRDSYGANLVAGAFGAVDLLCRLLRDDHPFAVHTVLREVLHVHTAEVPDAHMNCYESFIDIVQYHPVEQLPAEMQAGGGGRYGALVGREYGLELLCVQLIGVLFHPLGDRGLSEGEQRLFELLVGSVIKEAQGPASRGGVVDHLGHHTVVVSEVELVAYPDFAGGVHNHVPEPLLLVQLPEQEYLDACSCLFLVSVKSCRKYLCVIQNEGVSFAEILDDVLEESVLNLAGILVENHELTLIAPSRRLLCNLFRRQVELKL